MGFWKLVAAIVVGNLLTVFVATVLWLLFIASLLSSASYDAEYANPAAVGSQVGSYQQWDEGARTADTNDRATVRRDLSAPDENGCIKELAEEAGGQC